MEFPTGITARDLLRYPASAANDWYIPRTAGGTRLHAADGWEFTVISVVDASWRHGPGPNTDVHLNVITDRVPDFRAMGAPSWERAARRAVPHDAGRLEIAFTVTGETPFTRIDA